MTSAPSESAANVASKRPVQTSDATSATDRDRDKLDCVVTAVVEPLAVDERDRGLQNRHPPLKRAGCRFVRIPTLFGTPPEALDILA